jgi:hypothetical protein
MLFVMGGDQGDGNNPYEWIKAIEGREDNPELMKVS